jgi:hypothetical protein
VIHLRRPALALVTLASIIVAAGCTGSSGTPTPPPITDPHEIVTRAITAAPDIKSLHIKLEVSGSINTAALGGSGSGLGLSGKMDLAGTTLEGDVDVVKQAAELKLAVPALFGMTGEIIVVDGNMYTKISLSGPKFSKSKLSDSVPVAIPSPGAIASMALTDEVASVRKALDDAGVVATLKPDAKIGGKDAYDIAYTIPIDKVNGLLAADGGSTTAGMTLDSAAVELWVYKDSLLPAKAEIKGSSATLGSLDLIVTLTAYNAPVTISAPGASDIAS